MNTLFCCCKKVQKSDEKMNTIDDKLDNSRSVSGNSSGAGLDPTLSVARPSPAQSETDVSKYTEELSKDPTVLRSANSIGRMFQGGSKQNITTIFAQNLIEAATSDLLIEIESCSSMSSGSCESGMDMMDSVVNITGLINAEKKRIKGERSKEDLGLLSQITKFKPISRETTETHQRESTHELVYRRGSKGATTEHLHRSQSVTTMADVRQGKIRTADGRTLRIKCSKMNEILRHKMIYDLKIKIEPCSSMSSGDAPYMMRSLTEVRSHKSAGELEEPPPAPRSSECLIKCTEGLGLSSGSSGGTPEAEPSQRQTGPSREGARVRATAVADSGAVVPCSADDRVRTAIQEITVSVTEGMMARNPYLRILNRAVSIVDPVMQATEAELMEATTLGLTRYFLAIMSGVLTRVAGLMPLIGATEEGGLPVLPSNASADRTDTATSTGSRLMAIRATSPPSVSGITDQKGTEETSRKDRPRTKLSKGRYPVRGEPTGIKDVLPSATMPRKASIPLMERNPIKPHTAAQSRKAVAPEIKEVTKKEYDRKRSPPKAVKSDSQEDPEGKIWKVPDRKRRSSLRPDVVQDLKSTLQHREEERQDKKQTLHFISQSSAVSQKSTVIKYGKGKKKDTATLETSQAMKKTALAYTPPPPPPPLPDCLPGGGKPTQAAPVVYTTQIAEVGQRAAVSSREQDGTEISTETATMATMMGAQFTAPPAPPPLPPPDYHLSGSDESDDEPLKEQAPRQKVASVFIPPKYVDRFQSQGFRHVEFNPSPGSSFASSVAGSDVGSVRSSRASTPAGTPRSSSPVGTCQGVQSVALTSALRDVGENRDVVAHGVMQPRRDSLAFLLQSQSTKLKHSTTVRRKTSRGETEDTAETSHMVAATVQAGRMPSPPPLPSFGLGLSIRPGLTMSPLSPMTLSQALHDAIGRREHAMPGHAQSSSPGDDSLSFLLQSQATKLKHTTTVRRKTSTGETEDTAEASQMVGAIQASHVPAPSPTGLGAQAQISAALAIPSPAPTTGLLMHHYAAPALALPQLAGLGDLTDSNLSGGTAMRQASTSAKVTQKTTMKKGDETVENVAEASETMATMEAGHIPAAPPLPTREQLRRPSLSQAQPHLLMYAAGFGRVRSPPSLPPMELLMSGISDGSGRVPSPPALPTRAFLMSGISGISDGSGRVPSPPALPTRAFLMSAISGISDGSGRFPSPPALPTRAFLMSGISDGSGRVTSPPAHPATAFLMSEISGISGGSGRFPSPPAVPAAAFMMSGISHSFRQVANPPALPPMEFMISGISEFLKQEVSQASSRPLLDLVGSGAMQPAPDPNRQYTVMSVYAAQAGQESNLSQEKTAARYEEGTGDSTTEGFKIKGAALNTNIPEPPPLPALKFFVPKPHVRLETTFEDEITQRADKICHRREMYIHLRQEKEDFEEFLHLLEKNETNCSPEKIEEMKAEANEELATIEASLTKLLMRTSWKSLVENPGSECSEVSLEPGEIVSTDELQTAPASIESGSQLSVYLGRQSSDESPAAEQNQLSLCPETDHGDSTWLESDNSYQLVHGEDTPCCLAEHTRRYTYRPPRFKCGSCDETLLVKYHLESDSEGEDEEEEGQDNVRVPVCHTKEHGHDHTWTYNPPTMRCEPCHVKMVMKMHVVSDEEDEDLAHRSVPLHHRTPSRTLPGPNVVVSTEIRPQPASEAGSAAGTAESSARQGQTPLENVKIRTTDGTSPPGSTAANADIQSAKGSAEPAAETQEGAVEGDKVVTSKDFSQKVWEALVGDDSEKECSKVQATPAKNAEKPSSASKDTRAEISMFGPEGSAKKEIPSQVKGPQEAGPSGTQDNPKKTMVTSKDAPSKSMVSDTAASAPSTANSAKTVATKSPSPSKDGKAPLKGASGQKESTEEKKEKSSLNASQKGANAPKAGPSGTQTAKLVPTKIPQPIKDAAVKRKTPVMDTSALSPRRIDVQTADTASVKETAPSPRRTDSQKTDKAPTKIPQPSKDREAKEKTPVKETTASSRRRTDVQTTNNAPPPPLPPTKMPQPVQGTAVRRKTPVIGTATLTPRRIDVQTADKASVKQSPPSPTKIPQPSANGANVQKTETASLKQTAPPPPPPPLPPTKIPLPVRRKTPMMGTTALSPRRADMKKTGKASVKQTPPPLTKIPRPVQDTTVKRKTPVMGRNARSPRRKDESQGVETEPASMTAEQSDPQTTAEPAESDDSEPKLPYGWVSSGIKKYNDEERARLDAEVDGYWGKKFSKNREKPWWNIVDPEEREAARLRHRSKTDLRPTGSSKGAPGATSASYKQPGVEKQVKYDVDRSPVMLPGHFGASTGVRSRASRPDVGLVPKKLEMEFFDSSEDSEDEIDLDKPVSVEDLQNDDYWRTMEKKAYAIVVKASVDQLETVDESPEDEKPVQEAKPTGKKLNNLSQMFQSRKEKEKRREREAREMAMKEKEEKKAHMFEHKSDPPNEEPFIGPPLPPEMLKNTPEKKTRGLTRHGHEGVPTLAAEKEGEASTSKKSGSKLTPTRLVGKIKGGFAKVKDSIKSKLSGPGESSD
ncbi:microtubule-associated protein futsch-like [Branchiostoma lanceolatum]|uniref:microtubule-associated protein futsch-like n=1 Tax=Branchiostoma lanceolatum TaxID=7740 RepID=UPI00345561D8